TAPTIIPAPSVPSVATARPLIWDSAEELSAWVTNGVSTSDATIVGTGVDALIQIDLSRINASLHGPDLDPALSEVQTVRMRYRWVDRAANDDVLSITMYLREPGTGLPAGIPAFFPPTGKNGELLSEFFSGVWIERTFSPQGSRPPYQVRFALLEMGTRFTGSPRRYHGHIEIDWIALT